MTAGWSDVEVSETLLDVQSACRIAVEILNDLLCFDKLESGILVLHKHEVPAVPFITDCVNMFASQAREGGVTLSVISCDTDTDTDADAHTGRIDTSSSTSSSLSDGQDTEREGETEREREREKAAVGRKYTASNLLESDTVLMDKFKMDQVLRNLISNALKFTPRGGAVTGEREESKEERREEEGIEGMRGMRTESSIPFFVSYSTLFFATLLCSTLLYSIFRILFYSILCILFY